MFPSLVFGEAVIVTGCALKRGAQVEVQRIDGQLYVLMDKSEWACQAAMGTSRSRSGLRGPSCLDKLLAHAVTRMEAAAAVASALADDPMLELEEHLGPPSKRRCRPLAAMSRVQVLVHLVAPADSADMPEDANFHVCVAPRATTRPDMYVLEAQVPALIAFARRELTERRREAAPP